MISCVQSQVVRLRAMENSNGKRELISSTPDLFESERYVDALLAGGGEKKKVCHIIIQRFSLLGTEPDDFSGRSIAS